MRYPRGPEDDAPLAEVGAKVKVQGVVEGHHQGGAVVQIPTAGGGAMGVPTDLEDLDVGDPAELEGTVVKTTRSTIVVAFETPDGATQQTALDPQRVTVEP